ncbi:flagellar protein FlaG [Paenibacillus sp. V4I7]|uniref:flagellar protein FlaG n=1 Tax=Paenibacillus sp. V4I7 TaxID=3042307 RepID=UPI002781C4BF|nr:flagellar protein FlaG [Paenibacillus sp. V4I7]MDQ0902941.1 flagellar protein FlaG [Paenibacillus sp. V4I7]
MSINNSLSGIGGLSGSDKPIESVAKPQKAEETNPVAVGEYVTSRINNTYDLKQAELQGNTVTISDAQVVKALEHAIKAMEGKSTSLEFSIHEKTKLISVKVLDKTTGETIREIPPEKSLDFVAKLWEMAGILVDERR